MANNDLIRIEITGLEAIDRQLQQLMRVNKTRALDEIGQYFTSEIQQRFVRSEDHEGRAWAPLKYRVGTPLVNRGILKASITHKIKDENTVEIGTNVIDSIQNRVSYARIHNYGGRAGRGKKVKIPKREFMGISDDNEREILEIAEKYFNVRR